MAVTLLSLDIGDLCLGKPPLRSLHTSATISDALVALKSAEDNFISIWDCCCPSSQPRTKADDFCNHEDSFCRCVGKVCMVDVICYLCKDGNMLSPSAALQASVSVLLAQSPRLVMHLQPSASLMDAIDLILEGIQNIVVPIHARFSRRKRMSMHNGYEYCWLTQEDIIRFILNSIGLFSPLPALSIEDLGIITPEVLQINYHSPASEAVEAISHSLAGRTSVAVVDDDGILIGEISPFTLACCDETVAAAIATLSAGDLMAYIDCGGPPEDLVRLVEERLKERSLEGMLEELSSCSEGENSSSSSSDEDSGVSSISPISSLTRKYSTSSSYSARLVRRAEAIVCHAKSSLVAVMVQAIAHRVSYVWVIELDDCNLLGIVTFCDMLKVFREHIDSIN